MNVFPPAGLDQPAGDAGDVQQIVHHPRLVADLAVEDAERPLPRRLAGGGLLEDEQTVGDRAKRVAQLVREHGEELVLPPVRLRQGGGLRPQFLLKALALRDAHADPDGVPPGWAGGFDLDLFHQPADLPGGVADAVLLPVAPAVADLLVAPRHPLSPAETAIPPAARRPEP